MASLLPGFEYDLFISYRQKDNKYDGWVTEFVANLKKELEATFKEDISIYLDINPGDGLLETHHVDKSLENKLKCLLFIPIISQTYCDPKSFAWEHEFCAFNKLAQTDEFGRDIKLVNGNVGSRILPVKIHDLDSTDKALIEGELGGVLRAIEFIYKESGVNRPLRPTDVKLDNHNKTDYRNQVNKVANAIKELITAMQHAKDLPVKLSFRDRTPSPPSKTRRKIGFIAAFTIVVGILGFALYYSGIIRFPEAENENKSIAVLPFENMNHDPEQDYFSNGIAEDILNHLTKVSDLKVKSRTSTLQYNGTQKSITEIGKELNVGNIVEGSVRRVGDKVRIVVQLIDARTDLHLWSETYDRELKDVLALQSEIAIEIANALKARLKEGEKQNIQKEASQNATAYDYYLKARSVTNNSNDSKLETETGLRLINEALQLDSNFSQAYSLKAKLWYDYGTFGVSQKIWQDSAMYFSNKAILKDPSSPDGYVIQGRVHRYLGKLTQATKDFEMAFKISPNNPGVLTQYGYELLRNGDDRGADLVLKSIQLEYSPKDPEFYLALTSAYAFLGDSATVERLLIKSKNLSPGSISPYIVLGQLYMRQGRYEKCINELKAALEINPVHSFAIDQSAWGYYLSDNMDMAIKFWSRYKEIESTFTDSTQTVPFRARLAMVYMKVGRKKEADALIREDLKIREELLSGKRSMGTWSNRGSVFYDKAVDLAYLGQPEKAVQCLDSSLSYGFNYEFGFHRDPMLSSLRGRHDYKIVQAKLDNELEFVKRAFSNALARKEASNELKYILK